MLNRLYKPVILGHLHDHKIYPGEPLASGEVLVKAYSLLVYFSHEPVEMGTPIYSFEYIQNMGSRFWTDTKGKRRYALTCWGPNGSHLMVEI